MKHYISDEDSGEQISIELGGELGPVDVARILGEIEQSSTPQAFGAKKGGGSISSDIRIRDGKALFCSCDGNFYCVDAETGREIWRYSTNDVLPAFSMDDDTIFISSYDRNLHAIDLSGNLKWKFPAKGKLGNDPCIHDGRVYFGSEDGNLYCVDKQGKQVWKFSTRAPISALPSVHKGMVLFGNYDGVFHAVDVNTGQLIWKFMCNSPTGGCKLVDDVLVLPCIKNTIYGLSSEGKQLWKTMTEENIPPNIFGPPWKGHVFVGTRGKVIMALEAKSGRIKWKFPTQEMSFSYYAVDNDIIYFGSCDGNIYAIDAETGKEIWSYQTTGPNVSAGIVHGGRLFIGSWDCHVYCLDKKTGQLIWKFQTSMSNMSDYEVDTRREKPELTIVIPVPEIDKQKKREEDEVSITDYGEFSGTYIDTTKTDYLGIKKKGYVK